MIPINGASVLIKDWEPKFNQAYLKHVSICSPPAERLDLYSISILHTVPDLAVKHLSGTGRFCIIPVLTVITVSVINKRLIDVIKNLYLLIIGLSAGYCSLDILDILIISASPYTAKVSIFLIISIMSSV